MGFFGSSSGINGSTVLRCKTTTNSAVEMALNGLTTYLTIPSGKVIFCNIKVVGTRSDGSAVATYERQYAVKNVAGTSSEIYAPVTIGADNAASTNGIELAQIIDQFLKGCGFVFHSLEVHANDPEGQSEDS